MHGLRIVKISKWTYKCKRLSLEHLKVSFNVWYVYFLFGYHMISERDFSSTFKNTSDYFGQAPFIVVEQLQS